MIGITSDSHLAVVQEYVAKFKYKVWLSKKSANWWEKKDRELIVDWTRNSCGKEYKDWFCHVGSVKDPTVVFFFLEESRATWFSLMWSNYIDNQQQIRDT